MISILIIIITTYRKYNMKHKNRKNTMKREEQEHEPKLKQVQQPDVVLSKYFFFETKQPHSHRNIPRGI